ncbi:Gfo/Idh/MocA family protein [Arthrobacter sp. MMS24-S77]
MNHTSQLRVAIVGAGMIGDVHARAARDAGAEILGVLASTPERSKEAAAAWNMGRGYASLEELIADNPDIVHICTPNKTHHEYTLAVLKAGLHVICEKPIAINVAEAAELEEAARFAGVVAAVPFVYRYHPLVREIRARRISGALGEVVLVHGSYLQDWLMNSQSSSWRVDAADGGPSRAFADIGSHWCDLAEFITGERLSAVAAATSITYPTRPAPTGRSFGKNSAASEQLTVTTEDTAAVIFRTQRGITVNTIISQVSGGHKNRLLIEVDGTLSSAVFDQEKPDQIWLGTEDGATILRRAEGGAQSPDQGRFNFLPAGHPQGYRDAFGAFVADAYEAVSGNAPEGLPTFTDGLRSAKITEAVLASASTGSWTEVGA